LNPKIKPTPAQVLILSLLMLLAFSQVVPLSMAAAAPKHKHVDGIALVGVGIDPKGIAYDSQSGNVYVANNCNSGACTGSISVINFTTNVVSKTISSSSLTGACPYGVAYDAAGNEVFVTDPCDQYVWVINPTNNSIVRFIPFPQAPYGVAYDPADQEVYVAVCGCALIPATLQVLDGFSSSCCLVSYSIGNLNDNPLSVAFDGANHEMYVTNSYGSLNDNVSAVDTLRDSVTTIKVDSGPSGLAYNPSNGEMYVGNYLGTDISIIDSATNTVVLTTFKGFAVDVHSVVYDPADKDIYALDREGPEVWVLPSSTNILTSSNVITQIFEVNSPYYGVYDPKNNNLYVTNDQSRTVVAIGASSLIPINTVSVGNNPQSAAFDGANNNLYVTNEGSNTISEISSSSNTIVATLKTFDKPTGIVYDSNFKELYAINLGNNTVSAINASTNALIGKAIAVGTAPVGLAYDPLTGNIYVTNQNSNTLSVINAKTNAVAATLIRFNSPTGIAFDAVGNEMYVSNTGNNTVSAINAQTNSYVTNIGIGAATGPVGLAFDSMDGDMVVATTSNGIGVINSLSNTLVRSGLPASGLQIGFDPANGEMFAGSDSLHVQTIDGGLNQISIISLGDAAPSFVYDSSNKNMYVVLPSSNSIGEISS
jgi:YVTN family beta-propeller protein